MRSDSEIQKNKRLDTIEWLTLERRGREFGLTLASNSAGSSLWDSGYRFPAAISIHNGWMEIWGSFDEDELLALRDKLNEILAACAEPSPAQEEAA